jgi:PP-loop superfamily ATP-utilizing enzyme
MIQENKTSKVGRWEAFVSKTGIVTIWNHSKNISGIAIGLDELAELTEDLKKIHASKK